MDAELHASLGRGSLLRERYRLQRLIGTGSMASVWLAEDEALARPVAVKIIADTLAADRLWVRRFEREARVAACLQHPNVVPVYDLGSEHARPFLVMQHVAGGTLADALAQGRALDAETIARELLAAVSHIHDAGLLHRDIKPSNVLLGPDARPRLTDFGVAKPSDATRLTSTGAVLGTARYLAPEVLAGGPASVRSDLLSCGRVLEDLAGERPSPLLHRAIAQLTHAEPERRPASAKAALTLLEGAQPASTRRLPRAPQMHATRPIRARAGASSRAFATTRAAAPTMRAAGRRPLARRLPPRWTSSRWRASPWAGVALAVLALVLVALTLAAAVSPSGRSRPRAPAPAPATAPLSQQLTVLAERVKYATER
jgi:eukaryotic-like serine/threonine-protein kinase